MIEFVLQEATAKTKGLGGYFRMMTGIGPMCTARIEEAARFNSKAAAMRSPACHFWLTHFDPVEISSSRPASTDD